MADGDSALRLLEEAHDSLQMWADVVERRTGERDPYLARLLTRIQEYREQHTCGGCRNQGAHRRHCPHHPDYSRWRELADQAEGLGDRIGPNEHAAANHCYAASGLLRAKAREAP